MILSLMYIMCKCLKCGDGKKFQCMSLAIRGLIPPAMFFFKAGKPVHCTDFPWWLNRISPFDNVLNEIKINQTHT